MTTLLLSVQQGHQAHRSRLARIPLRRRRREYGKYRRFAYRKIRVMTWEWIVVLIVAAVLFEFLVKRALRKIAPSPDLCESDA